MTTTLIPRPLALLKLIALGPIASDELYLITGWPRPEVDSIVANLHRHGRVSWVNRDRRRFLLLGPSTRRPAVQRRAARDRGARAW